MLLGVLLWLLAQLRLRSGELSRERSGRAEAERLLREAAEKYHVLDREYAEFRGREGERRQAQDEKLALLGKVREELETSLGAAALKASAEALRQLQEGNRESGEREREKLDGILKPMRDCVERLGGRVQQNDRQWNESMARFEEQIRQLRGASAP
jgi:DNA anti-recombination protein RmuC